MLGKKERNRQERERERVDWTHGARHKITEESGHESWSAHFDSFLTTAKSRLDI